MMKECFYCKSKIPVNALVCPYCTRDRYMPSSDDADLSGILVLVVFLIIVAIANCVK